MIANIENLISLWIMKERINHIQYLVKIWILKRINWQMTQITWYSSEELIVSYNNYLSNPLQDKDVEKFWWIKKYWWYFFRVENKVYFLKEWNIEERKVRRIKKYENKRHVKLGYSYYNIEFLYDTKA